MKVRQRKWQISEMRGNILLPPSIFFNIHEIDVHLRRAYVNKFLTVVYVLVLMAGLSSPVDNTESVSFGWMQTIIVGLL